MWRSSPEVSKMGSENPCHCKEKRDKGTIDYVWRLHTTLLMDRSSGQKISKDRVELNSTIVQWALIDFYRTCCTVVAAYTFFSDSLRPFIKRDYF